MSHLINNIYLIKNSEDDTYKIGVAKKPNARLEQLQTGCPSKLLLIEIFQTEYAYKIEKTLHRYFSHFHKQGEWFSFSVVEECNFINTCKKIEENIRILQENGNVFA